MTLNVQPGFLWNETVWNPSMIGARAWYDASDTTTVAVTSGLVDSVTDKSGNGLTLTASSTSRPTYTSSGLNGKNIFTYDGGDYLTAASAAPWRFLHDSTGSSVFTVWKPGTSSDPNAAYCLLGTNGFSSANTGILLAFDDRLSLSRNNKLVTFITDNATNWVVNTSTADNFATPNANQICGWVLNPSATASARSSVRVNGGAASQTNTDSFAPASVNATFHLQLGASGNNGSLLLGSISEVIFIAGVISDSNRQRIEGYLAHKWGLEASLPNDHPYKTTGPTP
jgi:hypothetical protein